MDVRQQKWTDDDFYAMRKEVLKQWPTGQEVDLEEAAAYHLGIPEHKHFVKELRSASESGNTLTQPRAGVALVDEQIQLLKTLHQEGGADLLPVTIDSYTRQNRYDDCETGLQESKKEKRSMLNGFPVVNHGVHQCRRVLERVDRPIQARHGTPDARLLTEIIHGAGWTSNEGGGISYNIPYAKKVSLEQTIYHWQYCDRLAGIYEEMGAEINREPFGPLTGTLVPPSISNTVAILEGLLAAEQGVRNLTLGYGQSGNLIQDVAAVKALRSQAAEYFHQFGYQVELTTVFHQWMGGFPEDEAKAYAVISAGAMAAAMAGATKVIVKTPHEAVGIPTAEANAQGLRTTRQMLNLFKSQGLPECCELEDEVNLIQEETRCIISHVLELGSGDVAKGIVAAFETGALDVPFAPSRYNHGKILPARDLTGAIRFLDCGNIPFPASIRDHHRHLLEERALSEGRSVGFQMVVDDIYAVGKGMLIGAPSKGQETERSSGQ